MAFDKTPTYNTHGSKIVPASDFSDLNAGDYVAGLTATDYPLNNCYLVKEKNKTVIMPMPGYYNTIDPVEGPLRGMLGPNDLWFPGVHLACGGDMVILYNNAYTSGSVFSTSIELPIGFTEYSVAGTVYLVACEPLAATTDIHFFTPGGGFTPALTKETVALQLLPDIVFLDGYLFAATAGETAQRVYNSTLGAPDTWDIASNFIDAEMWGDNIKGLTKHRNHLVVFGKYSTEFFYNAAIELGSPLKRQDAYAAKVGLYRPAVLTADQCPTHVTVGDIVYFIGVESDGRIGLHKIENFKVSRVEHPILDQIFNNTTEIGVYMNVENNMFRLGTVNYPNASGIVISGAAIVGTSVIYFPGTQSISLWEYPQSALSWFLGTQVATFRFYLSGSNLIGDVYLNRFTNDGQTAPDSDSLISKITIKDLMLTENLEAHLKQLDVVGQLDTASVELTYLQNNTLNPITATIVSTNAADNVIRFKNLGRTRKRTYTFEITRPTYVSWKIDGFVFHYNVGTK